MLISFSSRTEHLSTKLKLLTNALLTMLLMCFTGQEFNREVLSKKMKTTKHKNADKKIFLSAFLCFCSEELLVVLL